MAWTGLTFVEYNCDGVGVEVLGLAEFGLVEGVAGFQGWLFRGFENHPT